MYRTAARKILAFRSPPLQMAAQLLAGTLNGVMEAEFADAALDWNGHPSCLLLSFDCDFPEDVLALPRLVDQLQNYPLKASFACVGRWVEDYPDEHRAVLAGGYELVNHSYSHPELVNSPRHFVSCRSDLNERCWEDLSLAEKEAEIRRCHEVVAQVLGYEMRGFRVPHFGKVDSEELYPILAGLQVDYSSSLLASRAPHLGLPHWCGAVLEIPVTTCPRHPFASFDSWHAFYARGGWHREDFLAVLLERLRRAVACGALTNIYLDPKDMQRVGFSRLFEFIAELGEDCWVPTYAEFADWYRGVHARKMPP